MSPRKLVQRLATAFKPLRWKWLPVICLILATTGCAHLFSWRSSEPKAEVKSSISFSANDKPGTMTMEVLQARVTRFADDYAANIAQAADAFSLHVNTPEARLNGLRLKLGQATAAYTDASGVNPVVNALDMLVLITVTRMAMESYGVEHYGDAMLPMLETQRHMETNAWSLIRGVLKPSQEQELKGMIEEWRKRNPNQVYVGNLRFTEFASALGRTSTQATISPNSILSLLYIDPFAGLDPTAAAIQETRQLGERAMYYAQRMPTLLAWQSEVVALQMAQQPESRQILTNAQQLATSAQIFANTAQQLPQIINEQRQATIQQVFDELSKESKKSRELLEETRQTLAAGSDAAQSINAAIKSLDEFVRYVSPPVTNDNTAVISTNNMPFNVADYGAAASQIGAAARDLSATLQAMNQTAPGLTRLSQQSANEVDRVVRHAFWLGIAWIFVLLPSAVLAGLLYRFLAAKIGNGRGPRAAHDEKVDSK